MCLESRDQLFKPASNRACSVHFWVLKSNKSSREGAVADTAEMYWPSGDQTAAFKPSEPGTTDSLWVCRLYICRTFFSGVLSGANGPPNKIAFPSGDQLGSIPACDPGSSSCEEPPSAETT